MRHKLAPMQIICVFLLSLGAVVFQQPATAVSAPGFQPSPALLSAESISDTALGWIVGTPTGGYGTIIHTRDGGQTWVRQGSPGEIPDVLLNGVWAVDARNVWVVGESDSGYGVILRSYDGGEHWTRQGSPRLHWLMPMTQGSSGVPACRSPDSEPQPLTARTPRKRNANVRCDMSRVLCE